VLVKNNIKLLMTTPVLPEKSSSNPIQHLEIAIRSMRARQDKSKHCAAKL
jgi:hypothetical protein